MTVARFWREQNNRYNLSGMKCGNCGKTYFPPREICVDCHRKSIGKMESIKLKGTGKIVSYSIIHESSDHFKNQLPYVIAIIELDEGTRITGQIVNADCNINVTQESQIDSLNTEIGENTGMECRIRAKKIEIGSMVKPVFRKIREEGKSGIIQYGYKFKLI